MVGVRHRSGTIDVLQTTRPTPSIVRNWSMSFFRCSKQAILPGRRLTGTASNGIQTILPTTDSQHARAASTSSKVSTLRSLPWLSITTSKSCSRRLGHCVNNATNKGMVKITVRAGHSDGDQQSRTILNMSHHLRYSISKYPRTDRQGLFHTPLSVTNFVLKKASRPSMPPSDP